MGVDDHVPSLTHLRDFARARARGRNTHVAQDRRQVVAAADGRFASFAYERFITGVIAHVDAGNTGGALDGVVTAASPRMQPSYAAAARGMRQLLERLGPVAAQRRQRSVVVADRDGQEIVSLRIHLMLTTGSGVLGAFMYFSEKALTEVELAIMDTAVALAVRQIDPGADPAIMMVRKGEMRIIDSAQALTKERVAFLRAESEAYRSAWASES